MSKQAEQNTMNEQQAQPAVPKIKWNDDSMQSTYANVCNVMGTREEIMVLFGSNKNWQGNQEEVEVVLSQRILLTPYAAKRLQIMLDMGLKEYEKRFGEVKL
ncbi:MAG: DUF3467 domain-containing protein [Oceanospirillales bacterium]|nr:DUF3467 domain-containing protein [Oceanospirillales bacterium]MBR9886756.1 DUF3467 domain-containing protein [Oceanospirillales bacterium]